MKLKSNFVNLNILRSTLGRVFRNAAVGFVLAGGVSAANAYTYLQSQAEVHAGNAYPGAGDWEGITTDIANVAEWYVGGSVHTGPTVLTFSGVDSDGNTATGTFSAQASADASYKVLRTHTSILLDNPVRIGANAPYVNADGSVNEGGIPNEWSASAHARTSDLIAIENSAVAFLRFIFDVEGSLASPPPETGIQSFVQLTNTAGYFDILFHAQTLHSPYLEVNERVWSGGIPVVDGWAQFDFVFFSSTSLSSAYGLSFGYGELEGGYHEAYAEFGNTITMADIIGYDSSGNIVDLGRVVGESGTVYYDGATGEVPEPSMPALLIIAGFAVVAVRRRCGKPGTR